MKIKNALKTLPDYALPRLVWWVCEELNLPFAGVHSVEFNKTDKTYSGRVIFKERRVIISINDDAKFPLNLKNKASGTFETLANELELLVFATASNLSYLREYWETSFIRAVSQPHVAAGSVDKHAFEILTHFREHQSDLIASWNVEPPADVLEAIPRHQGVEDYKKKLEENNTLFKAKRKELDELKDKCAALRTEIHRIHVNNNYLKRMVAKGGGEGAEWTVPQRFLLADFPFPATSREIAPSRSATPTPESPPASDEPVVVVE